MELGRVAARDGGRGVRHNLSAQRQLVRRHERRVARRRLEDDAPERPEVRLGAVRLPLALLRAQVDRGPDRRGGQPVVVQLPGEPEVPDDRPAPRDVEEDVGGLQVPVEDPVLVQVPQALRQADDNLPDSTVPTPTETTHTIDIFGLKLVY